MRRVVPISAPAWRRSSRSSGMKNASSSAHLGLTSPSSAAVSIRCAPIEKKDFIGLTKVGNVSPSGRLARSATSIGQKGELHRERCGFAPVATDICSGR